MLSTSFLSLALFASAFALPSLRIDPRNNGPVSGSKFPTGPYQPLMDPMKNTSTAPYPIYRALTNFDYASLNLALYQEYIELDLFNYGLATFSEAEFAEAGLGPNELEIIRYMAQQEVGHATLLSNILGPGAAKGCTYNYTGAFSNVREYLDFNQQLTRWGESGVIGFLSSLNSRDSAALLHSSISTESRQQMIFRQLSGAAPMPFYFAPGYPQTFAWTLLAPYIQSCPSDNPRIQWSNFPKLTVSGVDPLAQAGSQAAVSTNRTANVQPGQVVKLTWEEPGKKVGPDGSYITRRARGDAKYAFIVSHINGTYIPLENISGNSATFKIPAAKPVIDSTVYLPGTETENVLNGTTVVAVVAENPFLTPYNLSLINDVLVAGPAIIQLG